MDFSFSVQAHLFPAVVFLFAVAIGIELKVSHFGVLLAQPRIPILGTLVHTLTFPFIAVLLVSMILRFDVELPDHLVIGILLIAACPSGGFSNLLVLLAKADLALSVLLTSVSSLMSFFTVPFFFWGFAWLMPDLSGDVELPVLQTLSQLMLLVVIPVGLGMLWRHLQPVFVVPNIARMQKGMQVLLYGVVIILVVQNWDVMTEGVRLALPWSLLLCFLSLSCGYGLSRLVALAPTQAATIAIESSIRNLAVAIVIATSVMGRLDIAVLPSVYFIAVVIIGLAFARFWRTRIAPGLSAEA